jgi:hypothetical protein
MCLEIGKCLDDRNRKFYYKEISSYFDVNLVNRNENNDVWGANYNNESKYVTIYAGNNYPNIGFFTHEMLHLYLFKHGFKSVSEDDYLEFIELRHMILNPQQTIVTIANDIAHYKMLPIFTDKLGFNKDDFFSTTNMLIKAKDIDNLIFGFNSNPNNRKLHFTNFIHIYFDTRYHFSDELEEKYSSFQVKLQETDCKLFSILKAHCDVWEKDISDYSNSKFFRSLFSDLEEYCLKFRFTAFPPFR